ncbi:porin [Flavobacteriaceae bacterium LSUCC0859]|nr:porin [Flavobacteriaceae bacterium LSUCC0859]
MIFKTITNKAKILTLSMVITAVTMTHAQEAETQAETPKFSLSGTIDAYFRGNLNAPNAGEFTMAPGSSFAQLSGFSLGMANLITSYEGEKVGFVADLVFGPRGTDAIFNSPMYSASGDIVNQLYMYWNVSESVTLTMGNFNTFLGYEVISPAANFNYSTSYLFSYGPFSHTGLKADFALSEDLSAMIGVFNQTDITEYNPTAIYAIGAQIGYKGQYLNFLSDSGAFEIDYTGGFNLSESFYLGLNAAHYDSDGTGFSGVALYPQLNTSETFAIGLRGEYFAESGAFGAIDRTDSVVENNSVFALTLTGSASIGNLLIKPEIRIDNASEDSFLDTKFAPQKSLSSFVLAAVYAF